MKYKGKALMLRVGGKTIALATSCSVNTTTQVTDNRTKDDANGPAGEFDFVDWNASSENVLGANENVTAEMVYDELLTAQLAGTKLEISMSLVLDPTGAIPTEGWKTDSTNNKVIKPYGGLALVESINLNAPVDGVATVSVNFKAVGPLAPIKA
jgi:hypothetical protein